MNTTLSLSYICPLRIVINYIEKCDFSKILIYVYVTMNLWNLIINSNLRTYNSLNKLLLTVYKKCTLNSPSVIVPLLFPYTNKN